MFVAALDRTNPKPPAGIDNFAANLRVFGNLVQCGLLLGCYVSTLPNQVSGSGAGFWTLTSIGFALQLNALKVSSSRLAVEIATDALRICGIEGYRNDSPHSITRHLRDAHSAALMISNERILAGSGPMHLHYKDEAL